MCGFLYAIGRDCPVPQYRLQDIARNFIAPRGPTRRFEFSSKNEYICQSILSVQSDPIIPSNIGQLGSNHFILYNGELFNRDNCELIGIDDTQLINDLSASGELKNYLHNFDGMFAIAEIFTTNNCRSEESKICRDIWLHRDLSGEKHIYYWFNEKLFLASSSPGAIARLLQYLGLLKLNESELIEYIMRRHYISNEQTCFSGIKQVLPGHSVNFSVEQWRILTNKPFELLESFLDKSRYKELSKCSDQQYLNHLDTLMSEIAANYHDTNRTGNSALVISGGIDSSLFSSYLQETSSSNHTTESFVGIFAQKDLSALKAKELSNSIGISSHYDIYVDEERYVDSLKRCIEVLAAPVHTHSLPSSRIIGDFVSAKGHKIMYGGEGADELFMGYETYLDIYQRNKCQELSSDYTRIVTQLKGVCIENSMQEIMNKDLNKFNDSFMSLGLNELDASVKSNALLDYKYQLPMVGLIASDTVIADCGVEYRTPFTRKRLLDFAINSPLSKLLGRNHLSPKYPLKELFKIKYSKFNIDPKIGFSGFPNESQKKLGTLSDWKVFDLFPFLRFMYGLNQTYDWKIINIEWFLNVWDLF